MTPTPKQLELIQAVLQGMAPSSDSSQLENDGVALVAQIVKGSREEAKNAIKTARMEVGLELGARLEPNEKTPYSKYRWWPRN